MNDPRPIALVGLRASGKTTLGRLLAERLRRAFVDLDDEIALLHAAHEGRVPALRAGEVLGAVGEERFRDLEERALEKALSRAQPLVLATGGGVVERARNRLLLRTRAACVWLHVPVGELRRRLAADPTPRPALLGEDAIEEVGALMARRTPLYLELEPEVLHWREASAEDLVDRLVALAAKSADRARPGS